MVSAMGLRPGKCYRKLHRPYTRQSMRKPRKGYVKGVPRPKITAFQSGDPKPYRKMVCLVAKRAVQIRDNALEAARITVTQHLEKTFGKQIGYFFRLRTYPHQVIRENPLATGAGADRFQQGMRQSFGNPIGNAARVKEGQIIMEVWTDEARVADAKNALNAARYKLPTPCQIVVQNRPK